MKLLHVDSLYFPSVCGYVPLFCMILLSCMLSVCLLDRLDKGLSVLFIFTSEPSPCFIDYLCCFLCTTLLILAHNLIISLNLLVLCEYVSFCCWAFSCPVITLMWLYSSFLMWALSAMNFLLQLLSESHMCLGSVWLHFHWMLGSPWLLPLFLHLSKSDGVEHC